MRKTFLSIIGATMVAAAIAVAFSGHAKTSDPPAALAAGLDPIYMHIEGIPGESTDAGHVGQIDVLSFHWGLNQAGIEQTGRGDKASVHDISITKLVDSASTKLMMASVNGQHHPKIEIFFTRPVGPNDTQMQYLHYTLENTLITSYSVSSGGDRPTESLSLNFTKLNVEYIPIDKDGKTGTPSTGGFTIGGKK